MAFPTVQEVYFGGPLCDLEPLGSGFWISRASIKGDFNTVLLDSIFNASNLFLSNPCALSDHLGSGILRRLIVINRLNRTGFPDPPPRAFSSPPAPSLSADSLCGLTRPGLYFETKQSGKLSLCNPSSASLSPRRT